MTEIELELALELALELVSNTSMSQLKEKRNEKEEA